MSLRLCFSAACLFSLALVVPACSGRLPKSGPTRDSGQSGLMNDSFAGQNACNPDDHLRPFIIEWDATDRSSFESYAASDVVVVRYEGCKMTVLEECRNDSVQGEQGAYKPVTWTSGALEKLNISNQGELYAKLPLSVGSLGGRVAGGEKFSMEYYVAGTRNATRSAVYRDDLDSNPGCEGATHFVYGINLGAYALGSVTEFVAEAGGSVYGFGAGGKNERSRTADKQGGDLGTCKSDTAKEVEGCKSPIRLTLRPIRDGANPDREAMVAPETDAALNAAGQVTMKLEGSEKARAHAESAMRKMASKDGKGCLDELDAYDELEPGHQSTDPKQSMSLYRAKCLMIAGKCDPGKLLLRKSFENGPMASMGPDHIDKAVDGEASMSCQGKMSPRDALLSGFMTLSMGAQSTKKTVKECEAAYAQVKKHKDTVKPKDDEDTRVIGISKNLYAVAPGCYARAGDCARAWAVFKETYPQENLDRIKDKAQHEPTMKSTFEEFNKKCAPKAE